MGNVIENFFEKIQLMLSNIEESIEKENEEIGNFTKIRDFVESIKEDYHNILTFSLEDINEICSLVFEEKGEEVFKNLKTALFVFRNEKIYSKSSNNPQLRSALEIYNNFFERINRYVLDFAENYNNSIERLNELNLVKSNAISLITNIKSNEQIDIDSLERIIDYLELTDKEKYFLLKEVYKYCLSLESPRIKRTSEEANLSISTDILSIVDDEDSLYTSEETPKRYIELDEMDDEEELEIFFHNEQSKTSSSLDLSEHLDEKGNFRFNEAQALTMNEARSILFSKQAMLDEYIKENNLTISEMMIFAESPTDRIDRYSRCSDAHREITVLLDMAVLSNRINDYLEEIKSPEEEYKELCIIELLKFLSSLEEICKYYNQNFNEEFEEEIEHNIIYLNKGNKTYLEDDFSLDKSGKISDELKSGIAKGLKRISTKSENGTFTKDSSYSKNGREKIKIHTSGISKILYYELPYGFKLIVGGNTQKELSYEESWDRLISNRSIISYFESMSEKELQDTSDKHSEITRNILETLKKEKDVSKNV